MQTADFTQRNVAVDIFRALTMFTMVFVNDLGRTVPQWLRHSQRGEDFIGLADYVLPIFLFVVGMSIPFAIEHRYNKGASGESTIGHILMRTLALLLMGAFITNTENSSSTRVAPDVIYSIGVYWILMVTGFILIWNQYPKTDKLSIKRLYTVLKFAGMGILLFLAVTFKDVNGNIFVARWGILGNIGWTYLVCALVYVYTRNRLNYLIPVWLVFIVICILGTRMNEASGGGAILNLPRPNFYNDFLGVLHIGNGSSCAFTIGGIIFSLITVHYANSTNRKKMIFVVVSVAVFFLAAIIARKFWILSKLGATPTWVFHITATAIVVYAIVYWLVKHGKASWFNIIKPAGTATLTCYCIPYVTFALFKITGFTLPRFTGYASVTKSLVFAFIVIGIVWLLGKLHIKLKI